MKQGFPSGIHPESQYRNWVIHPPATGGKTATSSPSDTLRPVALTVSSRLPFRIRITYSRNCPFSSKIASYPSLFFDAAVLIRSARIHTISIFNHDVCPEKFPEPCKKSDCNTHFFFPGSLCFLLQAGHAGSLSTQISSTCDVRPSQSNRRFVRSCPVPVRNFRASVAWTIPINPGVTPTTGNTSFGGAFGKIHRRQAVFPGIIVVACPYSPRIAPWKNGIFFSIAVSLST